MTRASAFLWICLNRSVSLFLTSSKHDFKKSSTHLSLFTIYMVDLSLSKSEIQTRKYLVKCTSLTFTNIKSLTTLSILSQSFISIEQKFGMSLSLKVNGQVEDYNITHLDFFKVKLHWPGICIAGFLVKSSQKLTKLFVARDALEHRSLVVRYTFVITFQAFCEQIFIWWDRQEAQTCNKK